MLCHEETIGLRRCPGTSIGVLRVRFAHDFIGRIHVLLTVLVDSIGDVIAGLELCMCIRTLDIDGWWSCWVARLASKYFVDTMNIDRIGWIPLSKGTAAEELKGSRKAVIYVFLVREKVLARQTPQSQTSR